MFKYDLRSISTIIIIVLGTMIVETIAGDCTGDRCGCYDGYCWTYANKVRIYDGVSWCYTKNVDAKDGHNEWDTCKNGKNCYWNRPCTNFIPHKAQNMNIQKSFSIWDFFGW